MLNSTTANSTKAKNNKKAELYSLKKRISIRNRDPFLYFLSIFLRITEKSDLSTLCFEKNSAKHF